MSFRNQAIGTLIGGNWSVTSSGFNLLDGQSMPEDSAIEAKMLELQEAYDALDYSRLRKAKYDLLNQDEMRYDDVKNSTTTWVDAIDTIKAAHPKP